MERSHRAGITIAGLLLSLSVTGSAAAGDALVRELAADVAAPRIADDIATLAGFDARQTLSETTFDSRGIGAGSRPRRSRHILRARQERMTKPPSWVSLIKLVTGRAHASRPSSGSAQYNEGLK